MIQSIYGQTLALDDVPDLIEDDPTEAKRRVDEAIDALHAVSRDIRNFIFGLRPILLEAGGLKAGLETIAAELFALVESDADLRQTIASVGLPILTPDGGSLIRGPYIRMKAYERTKTPNGPKSPRTFPIVFGRSSSNAAA